jgi:hypothetical protein
MKKQDLLQALEIVKPGLADHEIIEQSTSFAFINRRIVTYNDEISISHPVEGLNITGAIQAKELYELLHKIKQDEIEISISENEVILKAGKTTAGFILQSDIKLPLEEIGELGKWKDIPEGFIDALQMTVLSVSRDAGSNLTCIHINEEGFIESSDSYRITRYTLENKIPIKTTLIPAHSVIKVIKLKPTKITKGEGWIHFKTKEDTIISCRIFEDTFPDCTPHLKVIGTEITFPKTINDILSRAGVFSDNQVSVILNKNKINIESKSDSGKFKEIANTEYDGEFISFMVNPQLLRNILTETQTCIYNGRMLKFKGKNWEYINLLLELK